MREWLEVMDATTKKLALIPLSSIVAIADLGGGKTLLTLDLELSITALMDYETLKNKII